MHKSDKIEAILKIDKLTEKNNFYLKRNLNDNHRKSVFENLVSLKSTTNDKISKRTVGSVNGKAPFEQNKYSKNRSKSSDQRSNHVKLPQTPVTDLKRIQRNQVKINF